MNFSAFLQAKNLDRTTSLCADYPRSKPSTAALALTAKICLKSRVFRLCVGRNDTVGKINLHKLLFHQAFNSYTFVKNLLYNLYNCYESSKNQLSQIFSLLKIESNMPYDRNQYALFDLPATLMGMRRINLFYFW